MTTSRFFIALVLVAGLVFFCTQPVSAQTEMLQAPDAFALPGVTPPSEQEQEMAPMIAAPVAPAPIAPPPTLAPPALDPVENRAELVAMVLQTLSEKDKAAIIDETVGVNISCQRKGLYSMFYDCSCIAGRFFEERVLYPEQATDLLVGKVQNECTSDSGVAGYSFEQCIGSMSYTISRDTLSGYCTCYANKMAELYTRSPNSNYDWIRHLGAQATTACIGAARPRN